MKNIRILYVEDDFEIRENYTIILESYFGETHSVETAKEALELYERNSYDLLLLDINLKESSGLDIAKYVRKNDFETKIIILTAYSDRERLLEAVSLKLDDYLIKPINNESFINTIRKSLSQKEEIYVKNDSLEIYKDLSWNKNDLILTYKQKEIKLTKLENKLIKLLTTSKDNYIEKDTLILNIWEDELPDHNYNQKLVQLIYRLNKKIIKITEIDKNIIFNHYSIGYKLIS